MAEFSENRHISNLINMSCKVSTDAIILELQWQLSVERKLGIS